MNTNELVEGNYMKTLLRAVLLFGDLHRSFPVHEIRISGFLVLNNALKLYPCCRIVIESEQRA